jgi:hypothetical protein
VRIALDSSVLIAAHISRAGVCAELLEGVLLHHELVISGFILEELGESWLRHSVFRGAMLIRSAPSFVESALSYIRPICRQTYAEILPTCRRWAPRFPVHVRYSSASRDLLDMPTIPAIPIIRPAEYWRRTAATE